MARFILAVGWRPAGSEKKFDALTDVFESGHVEKLRPESRERSLLAIHVALAPAEVVGTLRDIRANDEWVDLTLRLSGEDNRHRVPAKIHAITSTGDICEVEFRGRPTRALVEAL